MKPTKPITIYLVLSLAFMFLAGYVAHGAGLATNTVTLFWPAATNEPVPIVYEIQQSPSLVLPSWVTIQTLPATTTQLTLTISKDLLFWRMRLLNATNQAWTGDFGLAVSTLWPSQGGGLGIRLGP